MQHCLGHIYIFYVWQQSKSAVNPVNVRLQDFGEFMRENRLTPFPDAMVDTLGRTPIERAKSQLERHTRYWPMIISQTTIFNMQAVRHHLYNKLTYLKYFSFSAVNSLFERCFSCLFRAVVLFMMSLACVSGGAFSKSHSEGHSNR